MKLSAPANDERFTDRCRELAQQSDHASTTAVDLKDRR